MPICY
ncbi:hypothetical protein D030_5378B, partial [Vibrio parahaemolyticus AQ3810]